jgi:hypothetical protein
LAKHLRNGPFHLIRGNPPPAPPSESKPRARFFGQITATGKPRCFRSSSTSLCVTRNAASQLSRFRP